MYRAEETVIKAFFFCKESYKFLRVVEFDPTEDITHYASVYEGVKPYALPGEIVFCTEGYPVLIDTDDLEYVETPSWLASIAKPSKS